jgi:protein arginine kinase activator
MKCEACQKQEATIAYTHIVENQKRTLHLCRACVSTRQAGSGEVPASSPPPPAVAKPIEPSDAKAEESATVRCGRCSMTYEEFRKAGRLGCPSCYEAFDPQLERLLKRIHGATRHQGKGPPGPRPRVPAAEELTQLRRELEAAVAAEAYERAAKVRDRIRALEDRPTPPTSTIRQDETERRRP